MPNYDGIYLGPTGNWKGNVNIFYIETGKVNKTRTFVSFPVQYRVIAMVNRQRRNFQKQTQIHNIYFLNRHKDKYAWDNDDLYDNYIALVEDGVSHPHLSDDMTGVELTSETIGVFQVISREDGEIEIIDPSQEQLVQPKIHNNSLSVSGLDRTPVVPLVNSANDEDIVDLSQECGIIPNS